MSNPSARKRRRRGGASSTASVEDAAAAVHENTAAFLDSGAGDAQAIAASIAAAGVSPDQLDQEGEAPTFVEGLHLELVPPSKCKWAVLPAASLTICTTAATRAYSHIPGKFYVLALKDASGKVVRLNGSQGAYMDFYQDDPQTGVHFVTRLKSPGGYASDGYHYFNAHTYLVPGKFTIKFGLSRRSTMHFGRVPAVAYTTVVRDPELEEIEREMARIAAMQRKELLPRDLRYIRSLKLKELPSEEQLQDIEKHLDKDAESIKDYIIELLEGGAGRGGRKRRRGDATGPLTGAAKRKGAFAPDRLGGTEFLDYSLQQVRSKDSHKGKPKKSRAKIKGVPRPKIPSKIMRTLRRYPHEPIAAGETGTLWSTSAAVAELAKRIGVSAVKASKVAERRKVSAPAVVEKKPLFDNNYEDQILAAARNRRRSKAKATGVAGRPRRERRPSHKGAFL